MKIAIPTKARAYEQETLKILCKCFDKNELFLFVEPQDYESYLKYELVANVIKIDANDLGIRYVRKQIEDFFGDEIYFVLDDDITEFRYRKGRTKTGYHKLVGAKPLNVRAIFWNVENFLKDHEEYGQATISYAKSNWLWEESTKENTRVYMFWANNGKVLRKHNVRTDFNKYVFADYDFTLELLSRGLKNIAFYKYAFNSVKMSTNPGGLQSFNRKKLSEESVDYMMKKWGEDIIKRFYNKDHQLSEIKINWKKAFNLKK